ncbi:MAG TPA: RrF2 family transcriptional regulator [Syntrophaceae bacterium]|nr:RrF2 family transcriptional regulator [Syntrophaceae bacterium]
MMALSTKARYGSRIMLELALQYEKGPVLLKEIAERQEISRKYAHFLINYLKGAGLVRSIRGPKGGYVLARPPSEISMNEIVQTLEGSISPVTCVDDPHFCNRKPACATYLVWKKLKEAMSGVLDSWTLENLVVAQGARKNALPKKKQDGCRRYKLIKNKGNTE